MRLRVFANAAGNLLVEISHPSLKAGVNWFTISAGVVQAGKQEDLRRLLERGRAALTQAVNEGRNRVVSRRWLESSEDDKAVARMAAISK